VAKPTLSVGVSNAHNRSLGKFFDKSFQSVGNCLKIINIKYMQQTHEILNGKKILIYHINAKIPLRRSNDLEKTTISIINGNGVLSQVLKKIKDGEVEILVTIGIDPATVKLLQVAIDKSRDYIVLIEHESKDHETRDAFLADLASKLLEAEGGASYRVNVSDSPVLSLNLGESERAKLKLDEH